MFHPCLALAVLVSLDSVDEYLQREMARNHIPGLEVAIVRHGQIVKLKAYGKANLEWDAPMTVGTAVQLASTTKTFTGAALALLAQQGKLRFKDPITRYFPDLPADWKGVTIQHLATHTSGVPEIPGLDTQSTVRDAMTKLGSLRLSHAPGEHSGYQSADFVVLAGLIEKLSGQTYPAFLQTHFFKPLQMSDTRFDFAAEMGPIRTSMLVPQRAAVYRWDGQAQQTFQFLYPAHAYAAGGVYSSARDLAKWAAALDKDRILEPSLKRKMWTAALLNDGFPTSWGIGWVVRTYEGRRTAGHSGGPAYSDLLRFIDDDVTIVVLQNQQRMYPYLAQGVADRVLPPKPHPIDHVIPDTNPSHRGLIVGLSAGTVDPSMFAPHQEELLEDTRNLLVPFAQSQGHLDQVRLMVSAADGMERVDTYEASYGGKIVLWQIWNDRAGRIVGLSESTP